MVESGKSANPIEGPLLGLFERLKVVAGLLSVVSRTLDASTEDLQHQLAQNDKRPWHGFGTFVRVRDITCWPDDLDRKYYASSLFEAIDDAYLDAIRRAAARE